MIIARAHVMSSLENKNNKQKKEKRKGTHDEVYP